ncbi:hypothetical protein ACLKA7_009143 [Drosophila subpalustris]
MLTIHLWITLLLVLWFYVLWSRRRFYKLMMQLPGPTGYPIIGSLHEFWNKNGFLNVMERKINKYGSSWLGWFGPKPVYFVSDPVLNRELLNSPHATDKGRIAYNVLEEFLGDGLLVLDEPMWSKHRKALNHAFGHNGLLSFIPIFNNEGTSLLQELDTLVDKGEIEMLSRLKKFSLRIATQTTMGTDVKKEEVFRNETIMENYQSYQDVEDEANTIVFAAFETTALTITYTLMLLAMFPEYQERVYEEIISVFPNIGDFEVSFEDIQKLEYLDMVINESMRLMPAIPLTIRKLTQDVKLSNGVELPKGLEFCISIFHTHRSKEIWGPEAHKFNPDNCLPRNLQDKHPYVLIPFLKGKRNCIGWKYGLILLKITLAKILRNYKFSTSFRFEDLVIVDNITLKLKDLPGLQLYRRN